MGYKGAKMNPELRERYAQAEARLAEAQRRAHIENLEHALLEPRSVEEWNHDISCHWCRVIKIGMVKS